jgi:predicted HAD superfamily Cof-like phosphohydrolase
MNLFKDVQDFHLKFKIPTPDKPTPLAPDVFEFRLKFLMEELEEFVIASETNNQEEVFDGLIDLVYVALGTADLCGFDFNSGWDRVQIANMSKVRADDANHSANNTGRGHSFDVVKPEGWIAPDLSDLV